MTQEELIEQFPAQASITGRVLLVGPELFAGLLGVTVNGCRVLLLVVEGSVTIGVGNELNYVEEGHFIDLLIWEPIKFVNMSRNVKAWALMPNYEFTHETLHDLKPESTEPYKSRHAIPQLPLDDKGCRLLAAQLTMLREALADTNNFYRTELSQAYFRCFMLHVGNLILCAGKQSDGSNGIMTRKDAIIIGFLRLVWRFHKEEHNIEFYSRNLCISSKHLARVVREKLGKTPYAVIRDELVIQAQMMLRGTTKSVQEISAELHFSEMAAFCKFFRKHNGMSPTAFRTSQRKLR